MAKALSQFVAEEILDIRQWTRRNPHAPREGIPDVMEDLLHRLEGRVPIAGVFKDATGLFEGGCHDWRHDRTTAISYRSSKTGRAPYHVDPPSDGIGLGEWVQQLAKPLGIGTTEELGILSDTTHATNGGVDTSREWWLASLPTKTWERITAAYPLTVVADTTDGEGSRLYTVARHVFPDRLVVPNDGGLPPALIFVAHHEDAIEYRAPDGTRVLDMRTTRLEDLRWYMRTRRVSASYSHATRPYSQIAEEVLTHVLPGQSGMNPALTRRLTNLALEAWYGTPHLARAELIRGAATYEHTIVLEDCTFGEDSSASWNRAADLKSYYVPPMDLLNPHQITIRDPLTAA